VDVREALNHFRTNTKIAETAFEVISRCRATSISSLVGGVAFVSATDQLDSLEVHRWERHTRLFCCWRNDWKGGLHIPSWCSWACDRRQEKFEEDNYAALHDRQGMFLSSATVANMNEEEGLT
jgi:hypothetical protein